MLLLGRRLSAEGLAIHYLRHKSLTEPPPANARKLAEFIQRLDAETVHLATYSLGGLVLLHLFDLFSGQPPGRVVVLDSPVQGSGVTKNMPNHDWLKPLLGRSLDRGLQGESNGTVAVEETYLPGATAFCSLNVGHMSLLFSGEVARSMAGFIRQGNF